MKKVFKIVGLLFLIILLFSVTFYFFHSNFGKFDVLSNSPRQPKLQIPITYNIGWWSNQKELSIDSLTIDIIESKINLFNSKSLIAYKVSGHLNYRGHWQPKIEEVHISERLNFDTTLHCDRLVEITPIVKDEENITTNGGTDKFEFKNEHIINSNHWGINRIKFICGQKEQIIELQQVK